MLMEILQQLGMPVAWDKLEGPAPRLTFLGFELNWEIRLPRENKRNYKTLWKCGRAVTRALDESSNH